MQKRGKVRKIARGEDRGVASERVPPLPRGIPSRNPKKNIPPLCELPRKKKLAPLTLFSTLFVAFFKCMEGVSSGKMYSTGEDDSLFDKHPHAREQFPLKGKATVLLLSPALVL